MLTIQVDDDVYRFLQSKAEPFVDDPNAVLRKLLLPLGIDESNDSKNTGAIKIKPSRKPQIFERDSSKNEAYVQRVLKEKFIGKFRRIAGYRMMFDSGKDIVYFHNFSKENGENLWYRLNAAPLDTMRSKKGKKWICFTNPADNYGFAIPLEDIDRRVKVSGWDRDDREVNIHVSEGLWRELDWRLDEYQFSL